MDLRDFGRRLPRRSSDIALGAQIMKVIWLDTGESASWRTLSTRTAAPPWVKARRNSKRDMSKEAEAAARTARTWSGGKAIRIQAARARTPRFSMATPLGRPVEPDVKMI